MKDGTLAKVDGGYAVRFERRLRQPPELVWRALTEASELRHWFPSEIRGARERGAELQFVFPGENELPIEKGKVLEFDPPRIFAFTWGDETLRFELKPEGGGTLMLFSATFAERTKAPRDAAGWHGCLDALQARLDGQPRPQMSQDDWSATYERYVAAMGLGDFPSFMKKPRGRALAPRGLEGQVFEGEGGSQVVLWVATEDVRTPDELHDDEHLIVLEGSYSFRINEQNVEVKAGQEFQIPTGARFAAHYAPGTRTVHLYANPTVKHASQA